MDIGTLGELEEVRGTILLRLDLNSPIDPSSNLILDDKRFKEHIPTIDALQGEWNAQTGSKFANCPLVRLVRPLPSMLITHRSDWSGCPPRLPTGFTSVTKTIFRPSGDQAGLMTAAFAADAISVRFFASPPT